MRVETLYPVTGGTGVSPESGPIQGPRAFSGRRRGSPAEARLCFYNSVLRANRSRFAIRLSRSYNQPESAAIRTASTRLRAPVLHMMRDRWLRTVPTDR